MNTKPFLLSTFLSAAAILTAQFVPVTAQAEILAIGANAKVLTQNDMPKHGQTMQVVNKKFGTAKQVKVSKGKVTKHNPKITQWVYTNFSVYFENSHVIHSVIHR